MYDIFSNTAASKINAIEEVRGTKKDFSKGRLYDKGDWKQNRSTTFSVSVKNKKFKTKCFHVDKIRPKTCDNQRSENE
jgi:hypothetical protein